MKSPTDVSSSLVELECLRCGSRQAPALDAYLCKQCAGLPGDPGVLDARYDYAAAKASLGSETAASAGLGRYAALLPPLPERGAWALQPGDTPLFEAPRLAAELGLARLWIKDETRNPTRCLKDRATFVAVGMAKLAGRDTLYCASAGNAAISLAAFCAWGGMRCHVFVPRRVTPKRLSWLRAYGATIHISEGDYDAAYDEAEAAGRAEGWYSRNCALNPYLVEGKKTLAFEVVEQLGGEVPDWVLAPVGDGCTLSAIGKGFREMREIGRSDRLPRLAGVQAEGIQPVVARFAGEPDPGQRPTRAASIAIGRPRNALRVLREVRHSEGTFLAVPDRAMRSAQRTLATHAGLVAELTSAASLAALERLAKDGRLRGQTALLVITGGRAEEIG